MADARERLQRLKKGIGALNKEIPKTMENFFGFVGSALKDEALTVKQKELIAIALSIKAGCVDCITLHAFQALEAGCNRKEIMEAAGMAMVFGGGPTLGAAATVLTEALDEFAADFPQQVAC